MVRVGNLKPGKDEGGSTRRLPCNFPADSLVVCESPVFMRVFAMEFFSPE